VAEKIDRHPNGATATIAKFIAESDAVVKNQGVKA
jgi:hypothetical protein